jgi:hypothetical protein
VVVDVLVDVEVDVEVEVDVLVDVDVDVDVVPFSWQFPPVYAQTLNAVPQPAAPLELTQA